MAGTAGEVTRLKKFGKLILGGIESKIVTLILAAMLLITGVFFGFMLAQYHTLSELTEETTEKQLASMTGTTESVIDSVIEQSMDSSMEKEAQVTDELFHDCAIRVRMAGEYAQKLLEDPDAVPRHAWQRPDASKDGELFVKVLLADGVEEADISDRLGVIANLSDMMVSVCNAYGTDNIWFSLPEGATLMADTVPGNWIGEDGSYVTYNAADRYWYKQAAEAGTLIFTDVEIDRRTGEACVTCAMPVYGKDGTLLGVAGADLYLTDMQRAAAAAADNGGFLMAVNGDGHVVIAPEGQGAFRVLISSEAKDLRTSDNADLAALVADALEGKTGVRTVPLIDGNYYMAGVPMETAGWALIAAYSETLAEQPIRTLEENHKQIQEEAASAFRDKMARHNTFTLLVLIILLAVMQTGALFAGKRIVRPLNSITRQIAQLGEDNLEFKMKDSYRTGDEVQVLAESFAALSHKTVEYIGQVKTVTAEKERIGTELRLAKQIQEGMLPSVFPPYPDRLEFDLYASMNPAKEVGGDFYDFFLTDENHLALVMADVSGKSVPGALFMMVSKAILKNNAMMSRSPAEILTLTNDTICTNNKMEMFVTVWLGILEISTGKIVAANAGHEYPVLCRKGGNFEIYKDMHGFVIGGYEGVQYREYELDLQPGDKLFLYTDGVPEATDGNQELFGTKRMLEALNRHNGSPAEVLHGVQASVNEFVASAEQFDDLTMLCLEYKGSISSSP